MPRSLSKRGCEPCKIVQVEQGDVVEVCIRDSCSNVVDTCAAGDSFAAGYLAARLTGESATKQQRWAIS
ncbi:PfkB family carbohydrate kinase [Vibrio chagasii]|nr:PfkB family carbohydrate kinase [Vibrio chagasii]